MHIVIGTPAFTGTVEIDVAVKMASCIKEWSKTHKIDWLVIRRTFICKARSMIVHEAKRLGADYLLWVDDDALIEPEFLDKMLAHDKDIVICPYPMRTPPYQCGVLRSTTGDFNNPDTYKNLSWDEMNQGLVEVDGGGTHCMLVKMSVFDTVAYPWFVLAPLGGTEDMYFCLIAKRCGVKIYCDTDLEARHIGWPQIVSSGNAKSWQKKFGLETKAEVIKTLPKGSQYIDVSPVES